MEVAAFTYCSLNAILAQFKNHPFGVNTTTELKNITDKSDNNKIQRAMYPLRSVPVLSDICNTFELILSINYKWTIF